ncbi:MAG: trypsin-like peptidase domain-containing protein [Ignavibacteriales bacterium]|nr:trypsin-like peptidase domain-containing protein [Ignavibacteriales bacterium]
MNRLKHILFSSAVTLIIASVVFTIFIKNDSTGRDYLSSILNQPSSNYLQRQQMNSTLLNERQNIITKTVAEVSPAVVGINVTEIRQIRDYWSMDPFWRQFFGDRVYNQQIKSLGSGAIISPDGFILTNDHVAGNALEAIVTLTDGSQYNAKFIGTDPTSDICLLKIDAKNLPYIRLGNSEDIMPGEWAIALGNPFGLFDINDKPTVTVGVISATGMNLGTDNNRYYVNMLQTDAAINSGNSGGPLVNAVGDLIGMNTLILQSQDAQRYGLNLGSIGVGFAIPVNKIKKVVAEIKEKGKVDRDFWTGLSILTINESIAKTYNLKSSRGVVVTQIAKNSPASKAGLLIEDIITSVNDFRINDETTLIGILQEYRTGDEVKIKILRDGKEQIHSMKLEKK